jgi:TetR/AcrR family transcriptional regulator, ethionamide resistance regulator
MTSNRYEFVQQETPPSPLKAMEPYHVRLAAEARDKSVRKGERTRLRLLSATAEFLQDGFFHGMRIVDICAAADVSQGTFYLYFKDKTEITTTLLTDFTTDAYSVLDQSRRVACSPDDAVLLPTLAYVEIYRANRGLMRCLTLLSEESSEFEAIFRDLSSSWNHRIAKGIQRRLAVSDDEFPECLATAYALASMVDEFLTKLYVRRDPNIAFLVDNPKRVAYMLTKIWSRTMTPNSFS